MLDQLQASEEQVKEQNRLLGRLNARLAEAQESEARRLSRELHDEVGQDLAGLAYLIRARLSSTPQDPQQDMVRSMEIIETLMEKVRDLSQSLRPAVLDDLGLMPALEWLTERVESDTDLRVKLESKGPEDRLNPGTETTAYRIVQEALTNVVRHADTDHADVSVNRGESVLEVSIQDEGAGFDPAAVDGSTSHGLSGMRERVKSLGGELEVRSSPGEGTRLKIRLPIEGNGAEPPRPGGTNGDRSGAA